MNITTRTGLVGFFLVLAALNMPAANATSNQPLSQSSTTDASQSIAPESIAPETIENRLTRLTNTIRQREIQLPDNAVAPDVVRVAIGWANGRGGDWINTRGGGWADGQRGGFVNRSSWVNGGGFYNYRY